MEHDRAMAVVEDLLGRVPRVKVLSVVPMAEEVRFTLTVGSKESLALLASIGIWSHLRLEVTMDYPKDDSYSDPRYLRYVLAVPREAEPLRPRTPLQLLGVFLTRELTPRGMLDPAESIRLQRAWEFDPL